MSYLCLLLFIKDTQLRMDAGDQCLLDLQHSIRKLEMIFTCLPWVGVVAAGSL